MHRRRRNLLRTLAWGLGVMALSTLGWIAFLLVSWGIASLILAFVPHHH